MLEGSGGEVAQLSEPLTPISGIGPAVEKINQGQGVSGEDSQIIEGVSNGGRLDLVIVGKLGELCSQFIF